MVPFVSFEGVDGSGKTTQVALLVGELRRRGKQVLQTKEPDGGHIGGAVRRILTDSGRGKILSPTEELLLVSAARYDHVRSVIQPALARGGWVVTDRFYDSTFAFQVFETGVDANLFAAVTRAVVGDVKPDLTIILDMTEVEAGARRLNRPVLASGEDPSEALRDFVRIRRALVRLAEDEPQRCRKIDAAGTVDVVASEVLQLVDQL